ncbi:hypothetical protein HDE_09428 [Halotydeus destructor]|nr:hypothetical protein HDE_09428 [Halotydeus destructor]
MQATQSGHTSSPPLRRPFCFCTTSTVCLLVILSVLCNVLSVQSAPRADFPIDSSESEKAAILGNGDEGDCQPGSSLTNACERCAKITKSPYAYPLCCRNEQQGRSYCLDLLSFSLRSALRNRRESHVTDTGRILVD